MTSLNPQINELHRLYCCLTGRDIALDMMRESQWFLWMKQFEPDDLRRVIAFRKQGIKEGTRWEASLKFSNLIGQLDFFEEDNAEAKARSRPHAPATIKVKTGSTERIVSNPNTQDTSRAMGEILKPSEFAQKLKEWRMTQ